MSGVVRGKGESKWGIQIMLVRGVRSKWLSVANPL